MQSADDLISDVIEDDDDEDDLVIITIVMWTINISECNIG